MEIPNELLELRPKLPSQVSEEDTKGCELLWMGHYVEEARWEFADTPWLSRAMDVILRRIALRYVRREMYPKHRRRRRPRSRKPGAFTQGGAPCGA